jgi:hypothetical protein
MRDRRQDYFGETNGVDSIWFYLAHYFY